MSLATLWRAYPRSFAWLNFSQFVGAANDNIFKMLIVFFLVNRLGHDEQLTIAAASVIFVIPFVLFSHAGGVLADRYSKRAVIVWIKWLEVATLAAGAVAIVIGNAWVLYGLLFLRCLQSALFGPPKYGIVPELVSKDRLSTANSLLLGLTYLAVIAGTFVPSWFLVTISRDNYLGLALLCVAMAATGLAAAYRIQPTPAVGRQGRFSLLFFVDITRTLRSLRSDRFLLLAILGSAYFLFAAALIQQVLLLYGSDTLGLDLQRRGFLFPMAALGIAAGAFVAGRISGRQIEFGVVPVGAAGLTACCIGLFLAPASLRVALGIIFATGYSAGLFIVPLNAFIQYQSPADRIGEILAASNFLSFLGVGLSAAVFLGLTKGLGLTPAQCFLVTGVLTAVLLAVSLVFIPDFLVRFLVVSVTRLFYRVRPLDLPNVPADGGALLVSNHVTWVDALLISVAVPRRVRFIMSREVYRRIWLKPLFRLMRVILIDARDTPRQVVAALKEARQALDEGWLVCIFAEGGITRNGNLRGFRPGFAHIVKGSAHPVIPVHIGGAWGSIFSYFRGRLFAAWPERIPYPVTVAFGPPLPATATAQQVRLAVQELSGYAVDAGRGPTRTLARLLLRTGRRHWSRLAVADSAGTRLSYGRLLAASLALARALQGRVAGQRMVGILLPPSAGGAIANLAVTLLGKVPVNLNYTASRHAMRSAIEQCGIRTVLTARAFAAKVEGLELPEGSLFLEDLKAAIAPGSRMAAWLAARFAPAGVLLGRAAPRPDDLATVLFSSGSTGEPKGIMLSHHNVLSNVESFSTILHFQPDDGMAGVLPFFHSFGYTTTLWCPLLCGFPVFYHPSPLDGAGIATLVRENRLTVLLSTPTFLLNYLRRARREDFATLRLVVVGAEKLKPRVAEAFEQAFGIRPLEGYGATELSPVAAINVPDLTADRVTQTGTKAGSVGHPIPGVSVKVVDPSTDALLPEGQPGLVLVKGPNVMAGYLGDPDRTRAVIRDGWYDTGDIGRLDEDGFLFLVDRMSRYSKIAGEMVPHLAIEDALLQALQAMHQVLVVTAVADEKRGEQLIVLYTDEAGDAERLAALIRDCDLPNLWKPRPENLYRVESLPRLGSGKLDLKGAKDLAVKLTEGAP